MLSRAMYEGDGSTRTFPITFPYISDQHIRVRINTVEQLRPLGFQVQGGQVVLGLVPPVGAAVEIIRQTPISQKLVQFQNGAVLTEAELNLAVRQLMFLIQEQQDTYDVALGNGLNRFASEAGLVPGTATQLIDSLVQEVLSSALLEELQTRIGDIDLNGQTIVQETINRTTSIQAEIDARLADISNLQSQLNSLAQGTAALVFVQATPPVPGQNGVPDPIPDGARWYDSSDNNRAYVWSGAEWLDISDPRVGQNAASITSLQVALTGYEGANAVANAFNVLDTTVTNINGTLASQATSITNLQSTLQGYDGSNTVANAINTLNTRVTSAEDVNTAQASSITSLESEINAEANTRANAVNVLDTRVTAAEDVNTAQATAITSLQSAINDESSTRANAINALDTRVTETENVNAAQATALTSLESEISSESSTRANAINALDTRVTETENVNTAQATAITSLQSAINAESNTRASAINALDTRVTDTENVNTAQATALTSLQSAIDSESSTRANAVNALDTRVTETENVNTAQASSITSLTSSLNTKNRVFRQSSQPTATAVGDLWIHTGQNNSLRRWNGSSWQVSDNTLVNANAQALSALDTRVTSVEGVNTAQANSITALQSDLSTLTGDLNSEISARATAISGLDTRVTSAEGTIGAISSDLTVLQTSVGNNTSSIATQATSINGLSAQYTVKIDNNGHVSGFGLASTPVDGTPFSEFIVRADRFAIVNAAGSVDIVPFVVQGGQVFMQDVIIGNALIDNLTVSKLVTGTLDADIDVGTGRIVWDNGGFIRAMGIGFGTNNQFLEWFGPRPTGGNLALCSESTAISYLKTNGDAYFGGSLSAGVLKTAAQTTALSASASVNTGQFGTNGNQKEVVVSYDFFNLWTSASQPSSISPSATVRLRRRIGGGSWTTLSTQTFNGNFSSFFVDGPDDWDNSVTISGSFTITDSNSSTSNFEYEVDITSRTPGTTIGSNVGQTLGVISIEE